MFVVLLSGSCFGITIQNIRSKILLCNILKKTKTFPSVCIITPKGGGCLLLPQTSSKVLIALAVVTLLVIECFVLVDNSDSSDGSSIIASGTCGSNAEWTLDSDGLMSISGTGYTTKGNEYPPWYEYHDLIKRVTIGEGIIQLGGWDFFDCVNLSEVILPSTLKTASNSFRNCESLKTINIPKSMAVPYSNVFEGTAIEYFTVDALNPYVTAIDGVLFSKDGTILIDYPPGKKDPSYAIPTGTEEIGFGAFSCNPYLCALTIPSTVTKIASQATYLCTILELCINTSATLGQYSFPDVINKYSYGIGSSVMQVVHDGDDDFVFVAYEKDNESCWLAKINHTGQFNLPSKVTINGHTYDHYGIYTSALDSVKESDLVLGSQITVVDGRACMGNEHINSLTIGANVTTIGKEAFCNCSLKTVTLGASLKKIDEGAFNGCTSLRTVYNDSPLTIEKGSTSNGWVGYYADNVYNYNNGNNDNPTTLVLIGLFATIAVLAVAFCLLKKWK